MKPAPMLALALARGLLLAALLGTTALSGRAQAQPDKVPVFLTVEATESIGQSLAYNVRELLRRSPVMTMTAEQRQAWLRFDFLSVRADDGSISYTVVIVLHDGGAYSGASYWSSVVGYCGSHVTERCAKNIMAYLDQAVVDFRAEDSRRRARSLNKLVQR